MSSTSLTPPPATTSPFRVIEREVVLSNVPSTDYLAPPIPGPSNPRRQPSLLTKRQREVTSSLPLSPHKRVRGGTSVDVDGEQSTSLDREIEQNASAAAYTTTGAGPSSFNLVVDDRHGTASATSETGSILFSEQVRDMDNQPSVASGSTVVKGNINDYIPQPEQVEVESIVPDQTDDTALFTKEEEEELEAGAEEAEGVMEESQDQNDLQNQEEEDDGAEPPPWLTEGHTMILETADRMSRVLEKKNTLRRDIAARESVDVTPEEGDFVEDGFVVDEDGSYHSGDSDEYEMSHRPILERTAVKRDIRGFADSVNCLRHSETGEFLYKIVDRLGEGTFSSVYLAHDVFHHHYNNSSWTGVVDQTHPADIGDERSSIPVALKKILVTSSPARIENELHILESLRGCRNVSELITAFREEDQVIIVLPYHECDDFRHFYRHMDSVHMRIYMKTLLRGLKDIHKRGIIHRDVKPANFLFNYEAQKGILCDFGLAERYHPPTRIMCQHAPATLEHLHGFRTKTDDTTTVEQAVYNARKRSKLGEGRVGFSHEDKRPPMKTNRAGTRGFRAPEVLFKCPDQTVAIDIWSAGIILLSILTHKFPVFNSSDDTEALLEIAAIFGRSQMERCAMLHNRTIISNIPTLDTQPKDLTALILQLNPHIYTPPITNPTGPQAADHIEDIDDAIDLCKRLLHVDPTKRITADKALRHDFLKPTDEADDGWTDAEEDEVLDINSGKCGHLHGLDGTKHKTFMGDELVEMHFGQGIPTSRVTLCPEHEHYQYRTDTNPLAVCPQFPDVQEQEGEELAVPAEQAPSATKEVTKYLAEVDVNVVKAGGSRAKPVGRKV